MSRGTALLCTAFEGSRRIASGALREVALKTKEVVDQGTSLPILILDSATSEVVEVDLRGSADDVLRRLAEEGRDVAPVSDRPGTADALPESRAELPRGPGRPRLGVVPREVTLLPRHWEWLNSQPGGASVALRKLVEEARRANAEGDRVRRAQEAAYRFMVALAGDQPGFEEATRALFAAKREGFEELVEGWPADVRDHARSLASVAFGGAVP